MLKTWKKAVSLVLVFALSMMVCIRVFAVETTTPQQNGSLSQTQWNFGSEGMLRILPKS